MQQSQATETHHQHAGRISMAMPRHATLLMWCHLRAWLLANHVACSREFLRNTGWGRHPSSGVLARVSPRRWSTTFHASGSLLAGARQDDLMHTSGVRLMSSQCFLTQVPPPWPLLCGLPPERFRHNASNTNRNAKHCQAPKIAGGGPGNTDPGRPKSPAHLSQAVRPQIGVQDVERRLVD